MYCTHKFLESTLNGIKTPWGGELKKVDETALLKTTQFIEWAIKYNQIDATSLKLARKAINLIGKLIL